MSTALTVTEMTTGAFTLLALHHIQQQQI